MSPRRSKPPADLVTTGGSVDGFTGELEVAVDADGQVTGIRSPSPLEGMPHAKRVRLVLAVLERRWLGGDLDAARVYLQHERWRQEMKDGKPVGRSELNVSGRIVVVDDLGKGSPAALPGAARLALTPAGDDPDD